MQENYPLGWQVQRNHLLHTFKINIILYRTSKLILDHFYPIWRYTSLSNQFQTVNSLKSFIYPTG